MKAKRVEWHVEITVSVRVRRLIFQLANHRPCDQAMKLGGPIVGLHVIRKRHALAPMTQHQQRHVANENCVYYLIKEPRSHVELCYMTLHRNRGISLDQIGWKPRTST